MELKRLARTVDGEVEATWVLTQEQMAELYWYAITDLLSRGMAHATDLSQEDFEKLKQEFEQEHALKLLAAADPKDLPQS